MHKRTVIIASLVAMLSVASSAQLVGMSQEQITIPVGTIFEIQAATDTPSQYSWTLNQGQQFVEASRSHVFQTRFTQAGTYTLLAQVGDESGGITATRSFQINVQPRLPEDNMMETNAGVTDIISMSPESVNGDVRLSDSNQVLLVRHARTDIAVIAIDLDTERDANGDGNPANDDDTRDTLFRGNPNPLYIWFATQRTRPLKAGALLQDNSTKFQDFSVLFGDRPSGTTPGTENGSPNGTDEIAVLKSDNGTLQFAYRGGSEDDAATKLFQWKFGDGGQSLIDKPVHRYAESGTYQVSVTLRDLKTGKTLKTITDSIVVNRLKDDTPDTPNNEHSSVNTQPDTQPPSTPSSSGGLFGMIVKVLLGLIVSVAIGIGIMFGISKLKKKNFSLEHTMAKAEQTMVRQSKPAAPLVMEMPDEEPAPPTEANIPDIRPSTVVTDVPQERPTEEAPAPVMQYEQPAPTPKPQHSALEPSAEQLQADTTNAPSWLKAGIETAQVTGQTPAAPPPPALKDTASTEETSKPAPQYAEPAVEAPAETPMAPVMQEQTPEDIAENDVPEQSAVQQEVPEYQAPPTQAPIVSAPVAEPVKEQAAATVIADKPTEPIPPTAPAPVPTPPAVTEATAEAQMAPPSPVVGNEDAAREEREREKKRLKRQRYRENKKRRETEEKSKDTTSAAPQPTPAETLPPDDETVAIIRADNVTNPLPAPKSAPIEPSTEEGEEPKKA